MSPDDPEEPPVRKLIEKLEETLRAAAALYAELVRSAFTLVSSRRAAE